MAYETVNIEKEEGSCPACEKYVEKHSTTPPKIAVIACEGACSKGEIARMAANLVTYKLARESTARICLGSAFTKDSGQRNLVRRADKAIAIEGCFLSCSSRMMKGALPGLKPEIVLADTIYKTSLPFSPDEAPEEQLRECAAKVAEAVVNEYVNGQGGNALHKGTIAATAKNTQPGCCDK